MEISTYRHMGTHMWVIKLVHRGLRKRQLGWSVSSQFDYLIQCCFIANMTPTRTYFSVIWMTKKNSISSSPKFWPFCPRGNVWSVSVHVKPSWHRLLQLRPAAVNSCMIRYPRAVLCTAMVTRINTHRSRRNGHHIADDILKCIFLWRNVWFANRNYSSYTCIP